MEKYHNTRVVFFLRWRLTLSDCNTCVHRDIQDRQKGSLRKEVFSLKESLESLNSLDSLESLENGRILLCFPQSEGSLESLESLNSLEALENGLFCTCPCCFEVTTGFGPTWGQMTGNGSFSLPVCRHLHQN